MEKKDYKCPYCMEECGHTCDHVDLPWWTYIVFTIIGVGMCLGIFYLFKK